MISGGTRLHIIVSRIHNIKANCNLFRKVTRLPERYYSSMEGQQAGVTLKFVTDVLNTFAPSSLAQSWDNVGLLLEPASPRAVTKILLTNDLTEDVMDEALLIMANLIISYHPPIFTPLKRITNSTWKERILSKCMANNIALYSPHTSWDVVRGGVNDWLADAFTCSEVKPLSIEEPHSVVDKYILIIEAAKDGIFDSLKNELRASADFKLLFTDSVMDSNSCSSTYRLTIRSDKSALQNVIPKLQQDPNVKCYYANPEHNINEIKGIGRICRLKTPISIRDAIETLKKHLGVPFVQLALARNSKADDLVQTIAFVAGSGGSLLKNVFCDLKVTGEASHHEVLDSIHRRSSVVLTNHSNSERGFLRKFKEILESRLENPSVQIVLSTRDADPLKIL